MDRIAWVFGYGSLMWDPGFDPEESVRARLEGYARSFCLLSVEHRGTRDRPGLVLGLDAAPGGHCSGLALRIPAGEHDRIIADLRARELVTAAYAEAQVFLRLEDGRQARALAYVIRHDHPQYAGGLTAPEQARIIAAARGGRGPNADYLFNTARHLAQIGLADDSMDELSEAVRRILSDDGGDGATH